MSVTTPTLTEEELLDALRAFLLDVLPAGIEIVQGQDNSVPMPAAGSFVVMTPARRQQVATTATTYDRTDDTRDIAMSTVFHFQLDIYGDGGADNAQTIATLFRDDYGVQLLAPYGVAPLYCDDGQQMPLVTGEAQYLQRWMMRGIMHANVAVTVDQQFADTLITTLLEY